LVTWKGSDLINMLGIAGLRSDMCISIKYAYSVVPESPLSPISPLEETDSTQISSILL
jgi:hypothetical protein